ncbi:MAG: ankyrin repeat domain-containing protein [Verrucomicrobia bacterium]|nr:ankyrin repeat domain-containing protein [Verrucomicrobiota bacterium]
MEKALISAVQRGCEKEVEELLKAGADPLKNSGDITTSVFANALTLATYHGNWKIVSLILSYIDMKTQEGMYYSNSVGSGFSRLIDRVRLTIFDSNCRPREMGSFSPLFQAVMTNDFPTFARLLKEGVDPRETLDNGLAPLHLAIALHQNQMVDALLETGADINQRGAPHHYCPLFVAVHIQNDYAYRKLLELGAKDLPTAYNHSALFAAVYWGNIPQAEELIARGADLKQYAFDGYNTLIFAAVRFGLEGMVKYLLSLGLHPDADGEGKRFYSVLFYGTPCTPLTVAVQNGHLEIVELLLKGGADPNLKSNGVPPLHFAISLADRDRRIIDLLLSYGASIDAKAEHNYATALMKAYALGQHEIASYLVACGASADEKDLRGKLPHEYAP